MTGKLLIYAIVEALFIQTVNVAPYELWNYTNLHVVNMFKYTLNTWFKWLCFVYLSLNSSKTLALSVNSLQIFSFRGETMAGVVAMAAVIEDFEGQVCVI